MDALGGAAPTMDVLRRQMAENLNRLRTTGQLPARAPGAAPRDTRSPTSRLRQTLIRRLGSLTATDPQFARKAVTLFVESTLVAEFSEALINEPAFRLLIRDIADSLMGDTETAQALTSLFTELLAEGE